MAFFVLMLRCNLRVYRVSFAFCHERVGWRAGGPPDRELRIAGNSMRSAGRLTGNSMHSARVG